MAFVIQGATEQNRLLKGNLSPPYTVRDEKVEFAVIFGRSYQKLEALSWIFHRKSGKKPLEINFEALRGLLTINPENCLSRAILIIHESFGHEFRGQQCL